MSSMKLSGILRPAPASVAVPTLVVHGTDDPLVPMEAGRDIAASVPGAQLMFIEGKGHGHAHGGAWPRIIEAIDGPTLNA